MNSARRPPREGVDWNYQSCCKGSWSISRPPREGVDWNHGVGKYLVAHEPSPSAWGRGLKLVFCWFCSIFARRPPREGVDWNQLCLVVGFFGIASPSAWGRGLKHRVSTTERKVKIVALRVRAWIETVACLSKDLSGLCRPPREGVDWNSLLRLWDEWPY